MNTIIFYQPICKDEVSKNSGTSIRPREMVDAFNSIGYKVVEIFGSTTERKLLLKQCLLHSDAKFIYVESANIPMCLSNRNHWPVALFADIRNFKAAARNMKTGIFYRDIHWKYPQFRKEVGLLKCLILRALFYIELIALGRVFDRIFVPCKEFAEYMPHFLSKAKYVPLPPGCRKDIDNIFSCKIGELKVLYSGNLSSSDYSILGLLEIVKIMNEKGEKVTLTVNTDENSYKHYAMVCDIISEMVKAGIVKLKFTGYRESELLKENYTVAVINYNLPDEVHNICMPLKLFQYIALGLPIVAKSNSAYGRYIESNKIGWTYHNYSNLEVTLRHIINNPMEVIETAEKVKQIKALNLWEERARKVEKELL